MSKKGNTKQWLDQHRKDPYVRAAQKDNYRSRAVYKLEQIDAKDRLIKPASVIVDLGSAPGGWSQYCAQRLHGKGRIVAIDLLPMAPLDGVVFIQEDFTQDVGLHALNSALEGAWVDLVLSDMAPNLTGVAVVDQMQAMHLAELTLDFCGQALKPGGNMLVKVFHGEGFDQLLAQTRKQFTRVAVRKPDASRDSSREQYLACLGWRGSCSA